MKSSYRNIDDLPLSLQAEHIAGILGISRAGAYNLMNSDNFPVLRIGKRMVVPKEAFISWQDQNIGKQVR